MHNVIHHTYTNIPGHDEDLEPVSFIRLSTETNLKKIHRFQHWYAYSLLSDLNLLAPKRFLLFLSKETW